MYKPTQNLMDPNQTEQGWPIVLFSFIYSANKLQRIPAARIDSDILSQWESILLFLPQHKWIVVLMKFHSY